MKIGDRVYVHGHVDEIRKDIVIIRNNGGYFGTVPSEVITGELPPAQPEIIHCGDCRYWKNDHLCECLSRYGTFETEIYFYCGFAERREE